MNGLEPEYSGKVDFEIVDATTSDAKAKIREYELGTHGLVVLDRGGKVRAKIGGHRMNKADIQAAIARGSPGG